MTGQYVQAEGAPPGEAITACFRVTPADGRDLRAVAIAVAAESSIGTWTDVAAMDAGIRQRLAPAVDLLGDARVDIAYPLPLFESGSLPQLLSSVAGNVFGMNDVAGLRLEDVRLPRAYIKTFPGPALGLDGVRERLGVTGRPLVGTIIKPKVELGPGAHAAVAEQAWRGGCDIVKDDENLTDQAFNRFDERIPATLSALRRAEERSGERKLYLANVTAETEEMVRRARLVAASGGSAVMVDVLTVGWAAVQTLRAETGRLGLVLHAHRAGHAAFTRDERHGVSMLVLARLARLAGVDLLHIGTGVGKMHGAAEEVRALADALRTPQPPWAEMAPVMPVASGGLHPLHAPALVANLGVDFVMQAGGGVHGHPDGSEAGARALRAAVEAAAAGRPLEVAAAHSPELRRAQEVWQ